MDPEYLVGIQNDDFIKLVDWLLKNGKKSWVIKGSDSFLNVIKKGNYKLRGIPHVVLLRNDDIISFEEMLVALNTNEAFLVDEGRVNISSTEIRSQISKGEK